MKKAFLSLACLACASMLSAQSTTQWKISIQNNGTSGGYIVDNQLKSTELAGYSTHYPQSGFMPAWFIRFPKGNYTVTSQNVGTIDVQQANTSKDILTDASAKSFSFRAPADGWYRFVLRGGSPGQSLHDFNISSTDVKGADAVYLAGWRSVPSLHLNTFGSTNNRLPQGDAFDWIYNEVQIPTDADFRGTYVEAFGFNNGYIGIQNNGKMADGRTNHTVIFSTWDHGDTDSDASLAGYKRSGVIAIDSSLTNTVAERFGGEGTGVHVILNGDYWKPGHWVRFLLNVRPEQIQLKDGSNYENTIISAWYNVRGTDNEWHYISSQRMAGQVQYFGSGFNSFLEEFTRSNTSQGHMPHKAYYRRVFTRSMQGGEWFNRNYFTFGHTDGGTAKGARNDRYQAQMNYDGEPAAYMQSGGYIEPRGGNATTLTYKQPGDFLPDTATLSRLVQQYVVPALHAQDVQRMQARLSDVFETTPQKDWSIQSFSSNETSGEPAGNGPARLVLDGKNDTYWHTAWSGGQQGTYPHYLVFRHNGEVTVQRIVITGDSKHSSAQYRAKTVEVRLRSKSGSWSVVGKYELANAETQEITFDRPITVEENGALSLRFLEGFNGRTGHMAVAEIKFQTHDVESLRKLVQEEYAQADRWNHYSLVDVERYLGNVHDHLATATEHELSSALTLLSQRGKVLKYGPINALHQLNAARAYVISNTAGFGTLVQPAQSSTPSLRNVESAQVADAQSVFTQRVSPTNHTANWLIVGDDRPNAAADYVIYNLHSGLFLQPSNGDTPATMSETPVKVRLTPSGNGFTLSSTTGTRSRLTAHPTQAEGKELTGQGATGNVWRIVDNFSVQPSSALVDALRGFIKTNKFVQPTGINTTNAAHATTTPNFDLAGRRVFHPTSGQIVINSAGKHIQE